MLSPEVEKFSAPNVRIHYTEGSFTSQENVLNNTVNSHYFNHLVSVVIPDAGMSSSLNSLSGVLTEDCEYYRGEGINVKELTNKDFIEAFLKKGNLSILSDKTHVDTDNCVALTPCGHLVLTLGRQTYQELGLEGKPSLFTQKHPTTFVVRLDLKANHFRPGKKNYERVRWCFTHTELTFDLLFAWKPTEVEICPSSVAAYFVSRGYKVSLCQPRFLKRLDYNVKVPVIDEEKGCEPSALLEWVGAYSIQADLECGSPEDFASTYQPPEGSRPLGHVLYLQWTGFFIAPDIQRLLAALRSFLSVREDVPWVSAYVQGFKDSPVSWALREHQHYASGENDYALFLRPGGHFLSFTVLASNKRPSRKLSSKRGR